MADDFKLNIVASAWARMSAAARVCKDEISGLAKVEVREGIPFITEIAVLEQEGTGASTHLDMEALLKFIGEDIEGRVVAGEDPTTDWRCWWHSHPGGGATPSYSSTDDNSLEELADQAADGSKPYFFGIVISGDGRFAQAYVETRHPIKAVIKGEVNSLLSEEEKEAQAWAVAEVKEKVKARTYAKKSVVPQSTHGGYAGGGHNGRSPLPGTAITQRSASRGRGNMIESHGVEGHEVREPSGSPFTWIDGQRYGAKSDLGLYVPDPFIAGNGKAGPTDYLPLMARDNEDRMRPILVRVPITSPVVTKKGKGAKRTKQCEKARAHLFENITPQLEPAVDITPGTAFFINYEAWELCKQCGWESVATLRQGNRWMRRLCLQCERLEKHCQCQEVQWTGDFAESMFIVTQTEQETVLTKLNKEDDDLPSEAEIMAAMTGFDGTW